MGVRNGRKISLGAFALAMGWLGLGVAAASAQEDVDEDFELEEDAEDRAVTDTTAAEREDADVDLMTDDMDAERLGDEQALVEEQVGVEEQRSSIDPYEAKDEDYFFLGGFYRHTFQPEWMLNWFFEESTGTNNPGGGLQFTWRKNSFSVVTSIWYLRAFVDGPFRANGDPVDEIEIIDSDVHAIFASADFLWSTDFNDVFALEYGIGVGLGGVFGEMRRTEAYPQNALSPDGPDGVHDRQESGPPYVACNGINDPLPTSPTQAEIDNGTDPDAMFPQFCDDNAVSMGRGGHFNVKADLPPVFPWLSIPHIALRIKPIAQLLIRVEGGFSTTGPFVGGSLAYGF